MLSVDPQKGKITHHLGEALLLLQRQKQRESKSVKLFFFFSFLPHKEMLIPQCMGESISHSAAFR